MRTLDQDYVRNHLANLWRWKCGMEERTLEKPDLPTIIQTQWSDEFEKLMRDRLLMGAFRYGLFGEAGKPSFNSVESAISRLRKYVETGNKEHLVDAANLCLVEYIEGKHPNAHLAIADDGEEHVKQV